MAIYGQMTKRTAGPWVEVDLNALCANYAMYKALAGNAETAAVVKCNGYGLGAEVIAQTLAQRENCGSFFVAYPEEGAKLRRAFDAIKKPATIFVFSGPLSETIDDYKNASLIPILNTLDQARFWAKAMPGKEAALHIETGMNRYAAAVANLDQVAAIKGLNIKMIMSHLACSSEPGNPLNGQQRKTFIELTAKFPNARRSLAASAGSLMGADYHFDLLRIGIGLYGGSPFNSPDNRILPVANLKAPIVQIREAAAGETVGYDATFRLDRPSRIATVALGYGDGYPRAASNRACASINGERAPIAGRVSMDLITLDVTDLKTLPAVGDTAEFFGSALPIHDTAKACGTISYELLTGLGGRVDHRYL